MSELEIAHQPLIQSVPGTSERTAYLERKPGFFWHVANKGRSVWAEQFARREDAELAKRALEEVGLDTYDKIEAYIAQHGRKAITRIMCEALQW